MKALKGGKSTSGGWDYKNAESLGLKCSVMAIEDMQKLHRRKAQCLMTG